MEKLKKIKLESFTDQRGVLTPIEIKDYADWPVKRVYFLTDVTEARGGHAVRGEKKLYVCQKGRIRARLHDGEQWHQFGLEGPNLTNIMVWAIKTKKNNEFL